MNYINGKYIYEIDQYIFENNYEVYNFFKEVLPLSFTKDNLK